MSHRCTRLFKYPLRIVSRFPDDLGDALSTILVAVCYKILTYMEPIVVVRLPVHERQARVVERRFA